MTLRSTWEGRSDMRSLWIMLVVLAFGLSACVGSAPDGTPTPSTSSPTAGATLPAGFALRSGDGFQVAIPSAWVDLPEATRSYPDAALEVGIPFTGQSLLQPSLTAWVDRSANLGAARSQAELAQVRVRADIPDAKVGELQEIPIMGALSALWFEYSYEMDAATSVQDTPLEAATYRVRDLTVQVNGKPQFGFRYSAAAADFSEAIWADITSSLVVKAD